MRVGIALGLALTGLLAGPGLAVAQRDTAQFGETLRAVVLRPAPPASPGPSDRLTPQESLTPIPWPAPPAGRSDR